MIQRIQTVYIVIAVMLTLACLCLQIGYFNLEGLTVAREYNLWITDETGKCDFITWPLFAILVPSAALGIYTVFAYNNRKSQARMCIFNVLMIVGWYILYGVYSRVLPGDTVRQSDFVPTIFAAFPALSALFYVLANRGIVADERLVRAADRIR